jgi:hypothetical protein
MKTTATADATFGHGHIEPKTPVYLPDNAQVTLRFNRIDVQKGTARSLFGSVP